MKLHVPEASGTTDPSSLWFSAPGIPGSCSFSDWKLWSDSRTPVFSQAADLQLEMTQEPHKKPDPSQPLLFGKTFTDHMLMVEWNQEKGWGQPRIQPFQNLTLHPACSALHYSLQVAGRLPSLPHLSLHLFHLSGSLAGSTSGFAFCVFLISTHSSSIFLRLVMFQVPCWVMLGPLR